MSDPDPTALVDANGNPVRVPTDSDLVPTRVTDLSDWDRVWVDGTIKEVTSLSRLGSGVVVTFEDDTSLPFGADATVDVVDMGFFFLTPEEGLARGPQRLPEAVFEARFRPRRESDGGVQIHDSRPKDVDDRLVWTQMEGEEEHGWRDYVLVPGYHRDGLNHVVCEVPWTDADADVEVNWN